MKKIKPQRTIVERRAINQVRMAMLKMAEVNIGVIFPTLNMSKPKVEEKK